MGNTRDKVSLEDMKGICDEIELEANHKYYNVMIVDKNNKLVIGAILNKKHTNNLYNGFKDNNVEKKQGYHLVIEGKNDLNEVLSINELTNKHTKTLVINKKDLEKFYIPAHLLVDSILTIIYDFKTTKDVLKVSVKDNNNITIVREEIESIEIIEVYK